MENIKSTNGADIYLQQLTELIASVKRLEEGIEALAETGEENHRDAMEAIQDIRDNGNGFSTFES